MPGSPQGRVRMSESVCAKKLDRLGRNPLQTEKVFLSRSYPCPGSHDQTCLAAQSLSGYHCLPGGWAHFRLSGSFMGMVLFLVYALDFLSATQQLTHQISVLPTLTLRASSRG